MFDFKKSISGPIKLKFSGKTLNAILLAPIYFWGVYFKFKGIVSVFGCAYPAGFGSLKALTNCFWPRKVGHINGLFVLKNESGGYILRRRKNQTNGRMASRVSRSLKPRCQGDQPTRSQSARGTSLSYLSSLLINSSTVIVVPPRCHRNW